MVESREQGQESRTTRKLRNSNKLPYTHCGVLGNPSELPVDTFVRADQARLVVLVNSATLKAIDHFTQATLREHETPLRLALLDRALADGFDAARFLNARDRACKVLCAGCDCDPQVGASQDSTQLNNVRAAAAALATTLNTINSTPLIFPASVPLFTTPLQAPVDTCGVTRSRKRCSRMRLACSAISRPWSLSTTTGSITVAQLEAINRIVSSIADENYPKLTNDQSVRDGVRTECMRPFY